MPQFIVRRTIDQFKYIEADTPEEAQQLALNDDTNWEWSDETYETETAEDTNDEHLMLLITFNPQAWINNQAINIDPEGPTTFTVPKQHLEHFTPDQLKYELEPYLQFAPDWIRHYRGPFFFQEHPTGIPAPFTLKARGELRYAEWELQNPNLMDPNDTDTQWYATHSITGFLAGSFSTLDEAFEFLQNETTDL